MPPEDQLAAGTVLDGRYRIDEPLGTGGMGTVYRATHVALQRSVAIKVLRADFGADSEWAARFRREAFATARLDHPNCVGVVDCGALDDGRPYLVMELVRGINLFDELEERLRVPVPRALKIIRHVLEGLRHAHAAGLVHRDVKPGNIMLAPTEDDPDFAKLLDFGVVKLVGDAFEQAGGNDLTAAGCAIGSPTYMSPDQVTGSDIDARSDLYSATVVLFELITGRPPFWSDDQFSVVRMHLQTPPPRIAEVAPDVQLPAGLEELVRDGLAKKPEDRIPTAQAYLDRLDRLGLGDTQPVQSAPPIHNAPPRHVGRVPPLPAPRPRTATARPRPPLANRRVAAIAAGVAAVALLAILAATNGESAPPAAGTAPEPLAATVVTPPTETVEVPELAEVHDLIRDGHRDGAIERLHALRREHPDRAYLPLLQGTLYLDKMWCRDGFDAYRDAIAIDPDTRNDPTVIRSSINALSSRSNHRRAARFLIRDIGAPAIPYLEAAAQSGDDKVRERAARVLQRLQRPSDG